MRIPRFRWLAILLIAGSCAAGYAIGKATLNPAIQEPEAATNAGDRPIRTSTRDRRTNGDAWEQLTALLRPDNRQRDIWNIISRLPADRITDALRELRSAQFKASTGSGETKRLAEIESALYFHWAESDPQAALADVSKLPGEPDQEARRRRMVLMKSVLAAWMQVDANAAYNSVKNERDFGYVARDMLVATWTPENVFQNAALYRYKRWELLDRYCVAVVADDTKRNAMFAALKGQPELKDRDQIQSVLIRSWATLDFSAAMAKAEQTDDPGIEAKVLAVGLNWQPASALKWAANHDIPQGGPRWEQAYSTWLVYDSEDAQSWFAEQTPEWVSTGKTAMIAGFLSKELDSKGTMKGSVDHQASGEKLLALVGDWQARDPQAAGKWLETASDSVRKLINGKGEHGHE